MTLKIEITSDFICPWCLIAEARLKKALEMLDLKAPIDIIWYPFELNPDMPEAGMDRKTYRINKFGSWDYAESLDCHTIQAAKGEDISFRFRYDLMKFTPNTLKAHRLTWFAAQQGKATEMAERILMAYFTQGQNISEVETLANLADEIGIDKETAKQFLLSKQGIIEVRELESQVRAKGIQNVPIIQIGEKTISGAQPLEAFITDLQKAEKELTEV